MDQERLIIDFINENYKIVHTRSALVALIEAKFNLREDQILTIFKEQSWRLSAEAAEFVK